MEFLSFFIISPPHPFPPARMPFILFSPSPRLPSLFISQLSLCIISFLQALLGTLKPQPFQIAMSLSSRSLLQHQMQLDLGPQAEPFYWINTGPPAMTDLFYRGHQRREHSRLAEAQRRVFFFSFLGSFAVKQFGNYSYTLSKCNLKCITLPFRLNCKREDEHL